MSTPTSGGFDVFDMADQYAAENGIDPSEIFAQKKEEPAPAPVEEVTEAPAEGKPKRKPWTPDASLLEGLPELTQKPTTYSKDEFQAEEDMGPLQNIADDMAIQESRETMNSLERINANIEDAKKRHGIKHLQIPEGQYHATITAAAGDTNYKRAQEKLDEIFKEVIETYPHFIREWLPGYGPNAVKTDGKIINIPTPPQEDAEAKDNGTSAPPEGLITNCPDPHDYQVPDEEPGVIKGDDAEVKVVIDKSQVGQIAWSEEEAAKIRKARTIELNIRESKPIDFGEISAVPDNLVDMVLEQYQRKTNDVTAALPASKYRCCFRGLSYPEVLDLTNSIELNSIDGERKKWSLCFEHMYNQSIGPWEEYILYKDPVNGMEVRCGVNEEIPEGVKDDDVHYVSKLEDFMRKTSYLDLEFMLWKILCATAMDKEIITIDCKAIHNGEVCGKTYDWIYSPQDLLVTDSINGAVLEDMKTAAEAGTMEDALRVYKTAPVAANNTVELSTSRWTLLYGHASGYEYVEHIYSMVNDLRNQMRDKNNGDPTLATTTMVAAALTAIKAILVPGPQGGYRYISGADNIIKAIRKMDEVDWQTTSQLVEMMVTPYQFDYSLRDIVCPQCKNKSSIRITSMLDLLFIVAQSLGNVQVELKVT